MTGKKLVVAKWDASSTGPSIFPSRLALALLLLLAACSHPDTGPPVRAPATPLDPETAGTIEGRVIYLGTPPSAAEIEFAGDPACTAVHPAKADAGDVLVRDGRVENAFVYIERGLEGRVFERPKEPSRIDQRGCLYAPRVTGAETGQSIEFLNSDPTLHNVHTQPERSSGTNFGMAVQGARRSIHIDEPEVMVRVRCDVHPWMRAYVGVLDHPYFTVTGKDGAFRLGNVPAGEYTVAVWHERFGKRDARVVVRAQQTTSAEFRFGG